MIDQKSSGFETRVLSAAEVGLMTRMFREARGWTQETLAEISGLTVRTIQRVENGASVSADSRRALSRAFDAPDIEMFNKNYEFKSEEEIKREEEEFQRHNMTLAVTIAKTGKQLADVAETINMYTFNCPDDVPPTAAELSAHLFDYIAEYGDCDELYSFSDKLSLHAEWNGTLQELESLGYSICYALRDTKLVGKNWVDKTPWEATIGYIFVAERGREPKQVAVPKGVKLA